METYIEKILNAGNSAPSGENCQPWRFRVHGASIDLYVRPERDASSYNWGQRGSLMACGAALENMVLVAGAEGFACDVHYHPDDSTHVATVTLSPGGTKDALAEAVPLRVTNRKPYAAAPLSDPARAAILSSVADNAGPTLRLVEDRPGIATLGRVGSINEEIMLTNRTLHRFFFDHINWTPEDDARTTSGFFIDTLELPPPARAMFKLLRAWPAARALNSLGMHKLVAMVNGQTNASAAAIGVVSAADTQPLDYILAGRQFERVWLAATMQGLSLQPLMGVLFFNMLVESGEPSSFTERHKALITRGVGTIMQTARIEQGHVLAMFRIGKAEPPTARSSRFPLSVALS